MTEAVMAAPSAPSESASAENPSTQVGGMPQKLKTKIDGVEGEVDIDELKRNYQKYNSSEKRFQEAAQLKKQAEAERKAINELLERSTKGDLSWLKGIVPKETITKWAESELLEHLNWAKMPESEKRAITAERELQAEREARRREREAEEQHQMASITQQAYQQVEMDIVNAVKSMGRDVKVNPRLIRRIAEQLYAANSASDDPTTQPMDAKRALERAYKGMGVDAVEYFSTLPINEAVQLLPPKLRDAVRKMDVEKALSQMPNRIRSSQDNNQSKSKTKLKRMSTDTWFEKMDKRF